MINLTVLNLKDLLKVILKVFIVGLIVIMLIKSLKFINAQNVSSKNSKTYINTGAPIIGYIENSNLDNEEFKLHLSVKEILKYELGIFNNLIEKSGLEINKDDLTDDDLDEILDIGKAETEVQASGVKETYSNEYGSVKVKNSSKYPMTDEILNANYELPNKRNVLIYHTHTCESYTPTEKFNYSSSGNFRTTDLNFSVARVGEELTRYLKKFEFNVIHDKTYHDFPAYSGSYDRSYETVSKILNEEQNKNHEIIFDLHRDAIGSNSQYAPTVKIGEEYAAQLMFVIGTNGGGLEHPNWQNNLKTAIKIQQMAEKLYPGLFKPIVIRDSRYNQNLGNGASIIEVGATGNTLEQCLVSMKYLAIVLNEAFK